MNQGKPSCATTFNKMALRRTALGISTFSTTITKGETCYNNVQDNKTLHDYIQHHDYKCNTQYNDTQHNNGQHNDTQYQNDKGTLSIMIICIEMFSFTKKNATRSKITLSTMAFSITMTKRQSE